MFRSAIARPNPALQRVIDEARREGEVARDEGEAVRAAREAEEAEARREADPPLPSLDEVFGDGTPGAFEQAFYAAGETGTPFPRAAAAPPAPAESADATDAREAETRDTPSACLLF